MTIATAPSDLPEIDLAKIDPLEIAQEIVNIRRTIAAQQARLEKGMGLLNLCYAEGLVSKQFVASDCTFQLIAGRTSYDWASVPEAKEAEAALKAIKDEAKKAGTVPVTVGAPSWRISEAKEAH